MKSIILTQLLATCPILFFIDYLFFPQYYAYTFHFCVGMLSGSLAMYWKVYNNPMLLTANASIPVTIKEPAK